MAIYYYETCQVRGNTLGTLLQDRIVRDKLSCTKQHRFDDNIQLTKRVSSQEMAVGKSCGRERRLPV